MNRVRSIFLVSASMLLSSAVANATILTIGPLTDTTGAVSLTNWTKFLTVAQFNPSFGTLLQVDITLDGIVNGNARFESEDASPTAVTMNLQALLTLKDPLNNTLVTTLPVVSSVDNAAASDGVFDFGGASGKTYTNVTGTNSTSVTLTAPGSLAPFTGLGTITASLFAAGTSVGSGGGNLTTSFNTRAAGSMSVTYTYDNGITATPEPGTIGLLGSALLGFGFFGRKRLARR